MIAFGIQEYILEIYLGLAEGWASDNPGKLKSVKELEPLVHNNPDAKFKWSIAKNASKHYNTLAIDDIAFKAFYNTIHQVAILGKYRMPPAFLGKPETGWKFSQKAKSGKTAYHSHPSLNLYTGVNPKDPRKYDRMSIVWWRKGDTIVFDLWKHSEYSDKLKNNQKK